jgi:hypothetical protein
MRDDNEKLRSAREAITLRNSPQQRERRQVHAYRKAKWLEWIGIAAALWVIIHPAPYWPAVWAAATIPLVALAMYWIDPGAYEIAEDPKLRRVELINPILFSGIALMLRAVLDIQLTDLTMVILTALAGGALLAIAGGALHSTAFSALLTFSIFAVYSAGLIPLANVFFDNANPRAQIAAVDALTVSSGKSTFYYAQLSPGIGEASSEVTVGKALFHELKRFDRVCVHVYPGALGLEWFDVKRLGRCRDGRSR